MRDVDSTETYISLYAGGGGLDMGFKRARPDAQCVGFVEHEASAAALLVDHVEAGLLDAAPLFTDAFIFPAGRFHGLVDWVIGGPPCQPFSVAGKQLGADDARNLWPLTLRLVEQIQPGGCFFENVPSAESLWYVYENVIPGLRHLGYEVAAGIFSAAEVGAPHNRERIFILGLANGNGGRGQRLLQSRRDTEIEGTGRELGDTGRELGHLQQRGEGAEHPASGAELADAASDRRSKGPAITGSEKEMDGAAKRIERIGNESGYVGHTGHGSRSAEQRLQPQGAGGGTGEPGEDVADASQLSRQVPQAGRTDRTQRDAATGTGRELADAEHRRTRQEHQPERISDTEPSGRDVGHTGHGSRSAEQRLQPQVAGGSELADASSTGNQQFQQGISLDRERVSGRQEGPTDTIGRERASLADAIGQRGRGGNSERQNAIHAFPPGPAADWSGIPADLWPATAQSPVRGVADGLAPGLAGLSRAQRLRIAGNGVVPMSAERAFHTLRGQL